MESFLKKKEEENEYENTKSTVEEPGTQEDKTAELETFLCDQCDSEFSSRMELNRHTNRLHKVTLYPIQQNEGFTDPPDSKERS